MENKSEILLASATLNFSAMEGSGDKILLPSHITQIEMADRHGFFANFSSTASSFRRCHSFLATLSGEEKVL